MFESVIHFAIVLFILGFASLIGLDAYSRLVYNIGSWKKIIAMSIILVLAIFINFFAINFGLTNSGHSNFNYEVTKPINTDIKSEMPVTNVERVTKEVEESNKQIDKMLFDGFNQTRETLEVK